LLLSGVDASGEELRLGQGSGVDGWEWMRGEGVGEGVVVVVMKVGEFLLVSTHNKVIVF
jgi:hypothetical protein